ncbi:MAG: class I adenylate-forming enzyme family protein [Candidatus Acidiferrales bacterium]
MNPQRCSSSLSVTGNFIPASSRSQLTRISDVVTLWAERSPNLPALVEAGGSWTYTQLASAIADTQIWLSNSGVRPGDRVMIVCENCRAFVAMLFAITNLDAWPVLVNARLSANEVDTIRDHCYARLTVYTIGVSPHAANHAERHGASIHELGDAGSVAVSGLNENVEPETVDADPQERVAALIYTSGTTGVPKGVMLTHKNLLFMASASSKIRKLTPNDRLYSILPMSHAVGLSVVLLGGLLSCASVYPSPRFDPMTARRTMEKERLTIVLGVPAMFAQMVEYAKLRGLKRLELPHLRIISSSGAPLHPATKAAVEELFGLVLHNGYGITECSPTIAQAVPEEPRSDTSVGKILPGLEVKFVDPEGGEVGPGEVGELRVRGRNVMKGYYRAPEETAAVIDSEGWFNTRDLARIEEGFLFIVGRTKELIVHRGFNVYPAEVEAAISAHPSVARCAVIGRRRNGDEEVIAFVQPVALATVGPAELAEHAASRLAGYKRPAEIHIVQELPVTPTGKIAKNELAKLFADPVTAGTPQA